MDASYNLVASKCAKQMAQYQNCVLANQDKAWSEICSKESDALTACAEDKVPQLKALKQTCGEHIKSYAECIKTHGHASENQVVQECQNVMRDLWKCTEEVMDKLGSDARLI
ncbi:hypothetical protein BD324DRAFT_422423 [Kockovaella imperatae]|uniref:IMS import disulfide relay-system CHCH-CHCH-like Cx9C domain-containing protein n=1 Tax=Kockovaella imperatae TaxID=4999 RepID=A0A1Y1UG82_9TREE|nr:hypothetical protein BD324DRAFT_422423 [Kockovaella imperatae]ORX37032.1 hypothetical protein BD324DRAFT_422423 [Kockovaella imperatae]